MGKTTKAKNTFNLTTDPLIRIANQDSEHSLLTLVQAEIIPRLMSAHRDSRQTSLSANNISRNEIIAFTQALLAQDVAAANVIVAELREDGCTIDAIYLQLLAPSARYLGELWEADTCNFSEVTLCLWRIQTMLYDLSPAFQSDAAQRAAAPIERRILIANLPGHQHTLGVSMLSEFFRREGWVTLTIPSPQPREIQDSLSTDWFDVLALSAGTDREIDDLQKTVQAARKTSRNPRLAIMVGGALLLRRPELVSIVGADGTANDANSALTMATNLVQHQREVRLN
ncbi:MAG: cobalamin B12-binding domain-containing protein [Sulfuritalea sp.]|nr:cobalamin B12-binding domain-containing protein [Polynucleobacter sp.]MCF8187351.1 cobalamin B12-binding domain-containing protein [Sulfuritalea sp.]